MSITFNGESLGWHWWYLGLAALAVTMFIIGLCSTHREKGKIIDSFKLNGIALGAAVIGMILIAIESYRGLEQLALNIMSTDKSVTWAYVIGLVIACVGIMLILHMIYYFIGIIGNAVVYRIDYRKLRSKNNI